jgi:hypothetical protein
VVVDLELGPWTWISDIGEGAHAGGGAGARSAQKASPTEVLTQGPN